MDRMLETGTKAPDFTLPDQEGNEVALSKLAGTTVVLYFYPKADTPGCTTQACGIRDHLPDYTAAGIPALGVSPDPVKAVKKFHDKQALNFTLLADEDHAVCDAYGVWAEMSMYGKTYWGALRATFIIDGEGTIVHVLPKASPKTHDHEEPNALPAAPARPPARRAEARPAQQLTAGRDALAQGVEDGHARARYFLMQCAAPRFVAK